MDQLRISDADREAAVNLLSEQYAVGRHLQLRLVIAADGRHTPRLWALRAHHPRFSYLQHYLPDLYQEDPDAADFLDRYLANVEGLFTAHEGRIQDAAKVLDGSFDAVLHFAASSQVGESVANPEKYWLNNVAGTLELLDAMRES